MTSLEKIDLIRIKTYSLVGKKKKERNYLQRGQLEDIKTAMRCIVLSSEQACGCGGAFNRSYLGDSCHLRDIKYIPRSFPQPLLGTH